MKGEGIILLLLLSLAVIKMIEGKPITTREKSEGRLREDRLDYAVTEEKLLYVAKFLKKFGYIKNNKSLENLSEVKLKAIIKLPLQNYQKFSGLNVTGEGNFSFMKRNANFYLVKI